jgi:intein-encoded DNA endonuclease-like protein
LLALSACQTQSRQTGDQSNIPAEEYAVYAAVIGNMFAGDKVTFDTQAKVNILVIEDRTVSNTTEENEGERLKQVGFSSISQETIGDYVAKNGKSHQLTKSLDLKLKYTLIPKEKIEQIFDGLPSSEFYKQFPDSGGYIMLSRAGINIRGDQAVVYMQHTCGGLCGSGHYLLLVKKSGVWGVQEKFRAWIS